MYVSILVYIVNVDEIIGQRNITLNVNQSTRGVKNYRCNSNASLIPIVCFIILNNKFDMYTNCYTIKQNFKGKNSMLVVQACNINEMFHKSSLIGVRHIPIG